MNEAVATPPAILPPLRNLKPNHWPAQDQASLESFYGKVEVSAWGQPSDRWEDQFLTRIETPYPMVCSWDTGHNISRIMCHKEVATSLQRVLDGIWTLYGEDYDAIKAAGLHLFGGCYNYRPMRGGSRLSLHSWGAAIDLNPDANPQGKPWDKKKGIPQNVIDIFAEENWLWGGQFKGDRTDPMHFQATR